MIIQSKIKGIIVGIILIFSLWTTMTLLKEAESNKERETTDTASIIETLGDQAVIEELLDPPVKTPLTLPFSGFIQNQGQVTDKSLVYYYSASGGSVGFASSEIIVVTGNVSFFITFPGSKSVTPVGLHRKTHSVNYLYATVELTNVPTFEEVWYYGLYPGIDLRYYMSSDGLKYEFIVQPGADPDLIALQVSPTLELVIEEQEISFQDVHTEAIWFQDTRLKVFQKDGSEVAAKFRAKNALENCYGFEISSFDGSQTLTIDPLCILSYSTYLGGDATESGYAIVVDGYNHTYLTGETYSDDFPTQNAYDSTLGGSRDTFVTKLNATGTGLVYSTYLGGSVSEAGFAIAVDAYNHTYITGFTQSSNFPTQNAYNSTYGGSTDAFVTKLNATGTGLIFSTYLGGGSQEYGYAIAVDAYNHTYITGFTQSSNFPTQNAYNSTFGDTFGRDVFVTKIIFDTIGPIITVESPANGTIQHSGATIEIAVSDESTDVHTILYNWDTKVNQSWAADYQTFLPMGEISHVLYVFANDSGDNWASQEFVFTTDDTKPMLILESPVNNTSLSSGTLIDITVSDPHLNTVLYNWNGGTNLTWSDPYQTSVPTPEGQHKLSVYINDSAGNWVFRVFIFTTDDTSPTVDISSPTNTIYNQSSVTLTYTVSDGTVTIYLDGIVNTTTLSSGSIISDLAEGNHFVTICAVDSAGNIGVTTVIFTIDSGEIPTSGITTPPTTTTSGAATRFSPGVFPLLLFLVTFVVVLRRQKKTF